VIAQTNPSKGPSPEPKAEAVSYAAARNRLRHSRGVKIHLRDKVELNATLYLPKTTDGSAPKTPVVFTLTPYISDTYHARGALLRVRTAISLRWSTFEVAGNAGGDLSRVPMNPAMATTLSKWLAAAAVLRRKSCDVGRSYAGFDQWRRRRNFTRTWRRSFRGRGAIRALIIHPSTMSAIL